MCIEVPVFTSEHAVGPRRFPSRTITEEVQSNFLLSGTVEHSSASIMRVFSSRQRMCEVFWVAITSHESEIIRAFLGPLQSHANETKLSHNNREVYSRCFIGDLQVYLLI